MFDILLLGVEHKYQRHHMLFIPDEKYIIYLSQRKHYAEWVRGEITRFKPQIILDEMNLPEDEPENRLEDTHVPWVYMDIPEHVRKLFKLSKEDREPGEEIIPEIDEPREKHWLLVINSTSTACGIN